LRVAEDEVASGSDLLGVGVKERAGFLGAAHFPGALAIDLRVIGAVHDAGELFVGGQVFPGNIHEFETGDAIDLEFPLVAREEAEAFLEEENDDQGENDDGQSGIRGEEELDRLFIREPLPLEAVGRWRR